LISLIENAPQGDRQGQFAFRPAVFLFPRRGRKRGLREAPLAGGLGKGSALLAADPAAACFRSAILSRVIMLIETSEAQRSLGGEFELSGVGLHTGRPARVRCRPAPPESGVVFHRVDLGPGALIPARLDWIARDSESLRRRTTLGSRETGAISTCEHLLSAFSGLGVDNALVEIDAEELPFLDGSARLFVERILDAGVVEQDAPRRALTLHEPVVYDAGGVELTAVPSDRFGATVFVDYSRLGAGPPQAFQYLEGDDYASLIAPARTFCFESEIEALREAGLIKGGSLDNAIVIGRDGCLNGGGLRFRDELVRHKTLDLLGDLMLLGHRPLAHVTASRAGHASHLAFAQALALATAAPLAHS
jgi:UDP-3-O-acyl N-acetylglucosamine deacetylase